MGVLSHEHRQLSILENTGNMSPKKGIQILKDLPPFSKGSHKKWNCECNKTLILNVKGRPSVGSFAYRLTINITIC